MQSNTSYSINSLAYFWRARYKQALPLLLCTLALTKLQYQSLETRTRSETCFNSSFFNIFFVSSRTNPTQRFQKKSAQKRFSGTNIQSISIQSTMEKNRFTVEDEYFVLEIFNTRKTGTFIGVGNWNFQGTIILLNYWWKPKCFTGSKMFMEPICYW